MKRIRISLTTVFLACALTASAVPCGAADPRIDAQKRQEEGIRRYNAGDMDGALSSFTQAYAIYPSAKILWNLFQTQLKVGRTLEATRNIHVYLASADPAATPERKTEARGKLENARKVLGLVKIQAPQGARLFIDGKPFPVGYAINESVELDLGGHVVVAETAAQRIERAVNVRVGETVTVVLSEKRDSDASVSTAPRVE
ncbi:hypothetical protein LZC95_20120 [Pendulispora brunnea]|uniref:PEGA domain-containing protein n=1 Tax=Pendulispora brunnea TaxID=2905690 RepID=A0ABZ2KNF2_9BACT